MRKGTDWNRIRARLKGEPSTQSGRPLDDYEMDLLLSVVSIAEESGASIPGMAKTLGCSHENVRQFFYGQRGVTLDSLADILGVLGFRAQVVLRPVDGPTSEEG